MLKRCALVFAAAIVASPAFAVEKTMVTVRDGANLINGKGKTLYTFDKDPPGKSVCNGDCAAEWPPFAAADGVEPDDPAYTIITRDDGGKQWAYNGKPLYTRSFDKGDEASGEGKMDGAWHVAHP